MLTQASRRFFLRNALVPAGLVCALVGGAGPAAARPWPERTPLRGDAAKMSSVTVVNLVLREPGDVFVSKEGYRIELIEELRRLGYKALGAENLVFGEDKSDDARFALGGTVTESTCKPVGWGMNCSVGVRWELLDTATKKVVYEVMTRHAEIEIRRDAKEQETAQALLKGAFYSLLSRAAFAKALASDGAPSPSRGKALEARRYRACDRTPIPMPAQADRVLQATVLVESGNRTGSGFLISKDNLALTAAHIVRGSSEAIVQLRDGSVRRATVLRRHDERDVALLALEGKESTCIPLAEATASVGSDVWAIGSPAGKKLAFTLTRGIVSGTREMNGAQFLQTDASISPGNSGGPLVDSEGRAAAVVSWKLVGKGLEGLAFGVPAPFAIESLGLTAGTATDVALLKEQAAASADAISSADKFVDADDPLIPLVPAAYGPWYGYPPGGTPSERAAAPTKRRSKGMMVGGIVLTGVGAVGVAVGGVLLSSGSCGYLNGGCRGGGDGAIGIGAMVGGGVAIAVGLPLLIVGAKSVPAGPTPIAPNPMAPPAAPPAPKAEAPAAWSAELLVGPRSGVRVTF